MKSSTAPWRRHHRDSSAFANQQESTVNDVKDNNDYTPE